MGRLGPRCPACAGPSLDKQTLLTPPIPAVHCPGVDTGPVLQLHRCYSVTYTRGPWGTVRPQGRAGPEYGGVAATDSAMNEISWWLVTSGGQARPSVQPLGYTAVVSSAHTPHTTNT